MKSKFANNRPLDNEFNPNCKLSNTQVELIRNLYKLNEYSLRYLGAMFNCSHRQILRIVKFEARQL